MGGVIDVDVYNTEKDVDCNDGADESENDWGQKP